MNNSPATRIIGGPVCELQMPVNILAPVLLYVETATIDLSRQLRVSGWSVALSQIVAVQVFIGDQRVGSAQLGQPRDDIAASYPAYPNARRAGFTFWVALPEGAAPGSIAVERSVSTAR